MATKIILKRGFKADAERLAKEYREKLGIHPCAPLSAFNLAEFLQIPISPATKFLTLPNEIEWLTNGCEWSALTMDILNGTKIILHNPFNSPARQQSDLMHELAHIICNHEHKEIEYNIPIPFGLRDYNVEQEEEAKCLGATLQIATPCLLWARKQKMTTEAIAEYYTASLDMVKYRMNTTGIGKQFYFMNKR